MKAILRLNLQALAEKINNLSNDTSVSELQNSAKELYEQLTVLAFVEENLKVENKTESSDLSATNIESFEKQTIEEEDLGDTGILSTFDEDLFVSEEGMDEHIIESATEKMIDIVAQMEPETLQVDDMFETIMAQPTPSEKNKKIDSAKQLDIEESLNKPNSLNDRLKKGLNIGLNDRIAFVKHLFNGSTEDFNRVVSQLNTSSSELEALEFLNNMVKPEYNNWLGKEAYEQRLLSFLDGKFS
ncbi:hypothetical protein OAX11_03425 [Flavobacteriaceae bacterium]|nr:hypothetical protein [Flavobacteriaceae bacterium]